MIVMKMKLEFSDLTSASTKVKQLFERVAEKKELNLRGQSSDEFRLESMTLGEMLYFALMGDEVAL